jgi:transcriptional regulator
MTTGEKIRQLRKDNKITQTELGKILNVEKSTISMYENNNTQPPSQTLALIAKYFNVSTDYLLGNETPAKFKPQLTDKDKKDIAKQVEDMLDGLDADNPISFQLDGNEIDDDTRELLRQSLQNALEFARLKAKEKFTPKKYRK